MTKNTKNAIILSTCAIVLGAILICLRFLPDKDLNDSKVDVQSINLVNESIDNINRITVVNGYGEYCFVKNNNNKLYIKELNGYPRNDNLYDELSDNISSFVADKVVNESNSHLEIYGLDDPRVQLTIDYNSNLNIKLLIGNQAPGNIGYYVMKKDKPQVYLVSNNIIDTFLKSKIDYISLNITSPNSTDIAMKDLEYLELIDGNRPEKIKIVKSKAGKEWMYVYNIIEPPINKAVSKNGENIIKSLESISAQRVELLDPTLKDIDDFGLGTPFATLNLKFKNQNLITLFVSPIPDSEDYFVMKKNLNIIYRVSNFNMNWVDISVDGLISDNN